MQITLKDRAVLSGAQTLHARPVDVSGHPGLTMVLVAHAMSGTGPTLQVKLMTSDNLEDWDLLSGATLSATTAEMKLGTYQATSKPWGRYVRAEILLTGTTPTVVYSVFLNLRRS